MGRYIKQPRRVGLGNPMLLAAAASPEAQQKAADLTDQAIGLYEKFERNLPRYIDRINQAWDNTYGIITGSKQERTRKQNRRLAEAKGLNWVTTMGPLYNACFGVSDWFAPRHPRPNAALSDPAACCQLAVVHREGLRDNAFKVGSTYGYAIYYQGLPIIDRVDPRPYWDSRYGGTGARFWDDRDGRGWKEFRNFGADSGIGCRVEAQPSVIPQPYVFIPMPTQTPISSQPMTARSTYHLKSQAPSEFPVMGAAIGIGVGLGIIYLVRRKR